MTSRRFPRASHRPDRPQDALPLRRWARIAVALAVLLLIPARPALANNPPEAVPQYATGPGGELVHPGTVASPGLVDLLAFVADADGDPLTVQSASVPPADGTLTLHVDGTATYTKPAPEYAGEPAVSFTVSDGTAAVGFTLLLPLAPGIELLPPPPSGLVASADTASGAPRVLLSWVDESTNEDGFEIYRMSSAESAFSLLFAVAADVESAVDSSVVAGETYTYVVRAFNTVGSSDSPSATVLVPAPSDGPAAPTDLEAFVAEPSPGLLTIAVQWQDRSADEAGFRVLRRTLPDTTYTELGEVGVNRTAFADLSLFTFGTTYGYVVEAFNSRGSNRSAELLFLAQEEPLQGPAKLQAVAGTTPDGGGSVSLTWDDRDVREWGFQVHRRTSTPGSRVLLDDTLDVNAESYVDDGAVPGTTYTYEVSSFHGLDGSDEISPAAEVTVTVPPPDTPVAGDDPEDPDDPRYRTETGVPLFLCPATFGENDSPDTQILYSLPSVPEPGFPDHGRNQWKWRPSECPEGTNATGILYTPDAGFCGTDRFLYRLYFTGTNSVSEDLAIITVRVNQPPTPVFTAVCEELHCGLDASASTDACSSDPTRVSPGIVAYEWRIDGQLVGSGPAYEHDFPAGGSYDVTLTVEDTEGSRRSLTKPVVVGLPPTAAFTYDCPNGGPTCTFDGTTSSDPDGVVAAWAWDFGDGGPGATEAQPSHEYAASGTYTVTLTVTDDDGLVASTSEQVPVFVSGKPQVHIDSNGNGLEWVLDGSGSTDDGTIVRYLWTLWDGRTVEGPTLSVIFPGPGTYTITLTVTDDQGQSSTGGVQLTVSEEPVADFPPPVCEGLVCSFDGRASTDDVAIQSYTWTFGDGGSAGGSTPTHTYATKGTYTVRLTVTDDVGQQATRNRNVTVSRKPVASFTYDCVAETCTFDGTGSSDDVGISSWAWNFGDGTGATGPTVSHTYPPGTVSADVRLTVTDELVQVNTVTETVPLQPPDVELPVASGGIWRFYSPTNLGIGRTEQIPITNVGPTDLHLTNRNNMVSGACFHQVTTPPAVVPPGGTVSVGVEMECASGLFGNKQGTLTIRSDDPDEDPYTLTIRGQLVGGYIPRIRLRASYSPAPGAPRASYVTETAHPTDEVAFYFDPVLGGFEERAGGGCPASIENPTYVEVGLEQGAITDCTFETSWDGTTQQCSSAMVQALQTGGEVVINTDDLRTDPATCKLVRPLEPLVRHGQHHYVLFNLQYNTGTYPRRVNLQQASRVNYVKIGQDVGLLQVLPDKNFGQGTGLWISGQSSGRAYTILKASTTIAGPYASAGLRLEGFSGTPPAGTVYQLRQAGGWNENSLTWNNWQSLTGGTLRYVSPLAPRGSSGRANVSSVVTGSGTYAFRLSTGASSSYTFFSSEASYNPPYLVVTTVP